MVLPNCVLQVWNTRATPSQGSLNKINALVFLRILQFECLSVGPSRVSAYLENHAHFSQIACRPLAIVTNGCRKCSGEFVLHCLHSTGCSLDSVFIFWNQFWCTIPAMQKTLIVRGWKDMFYSKREIIVSSCSWKFNTDKVFRLFSLFCKCIDLSMEWLRSAWMHVLKMFNVGA